MNLTGSSYCGVILDEPHWVYLLRGSSANSGVVGVCRAKLTLAPPGICYVMYNYIHNYSIIMCCMFIDGVYEGATTVVCYSIALNMPIILLYVDYVL